METSSEVSRNTSSYPSCKQDNLPALTIDLKKMRLRLYKQALQVIGNPEYIHFLLNPKMQVLVVRSCTEKEPYAQKIHWTVLKDKGQCCEFYSKTLLDIMRDNFFPDRKLCSYKINGTIAKDNKMILFNLNGLIPISDTEA